MRGNTAPLLYRMVCMTCQAHSGEKQLSQPGQDWAVTHTGRHPQHRDFSEQVTRGWTATMADPP